MKHGQSDDAWNSYRHAIWSELCETVNHLPHQTQSGKETGFSGPGYSLYDEMSAAVKRYCENRRAGDQSVPQLKSDLPGISAYRLLENPSLLTDQPIVTIDMETRTIDLVDVARTLYTESDPYWIGFDRLGSVEEFIDWLRHLAEKDWCTPQHLSEFAKRYQFLVRNGVVPDGFTSKGPAVEKQDQ